MPGDSIPTLPKGKLPAAHYARVTEAAQLIRNATGDGQFINADIVAGTLKIRWVGPGIPRRSVVVKVTEAIEGATGKYNGKILSGTPIPNDTDPLDMPESMTVPADDNCLIINLSEDIGSAGTSAVFGSPYHNGIVVGTTEDGVTCVVIDTGITVPTILHGKIKTPGWDSETRPTHVILTRCDEDGITIGDPDAEIWAWIIHPTDATGLGFSYLQFTVVGAVYSFIPDGTHTEGETTYNAGAILPYPNRTYNGKVTTSWSEGDNFVMVNPAAGDTAVAAYLGDPVKCWLTSPITNTGIKGVNLVADAIITIAPYRVLSGALEYHAVNVPTVDGRVAVNADDTVDWLENQIIGLSPHIAVDTVTGADKTPIVEIQHQNSAITANKLEALTPTFDTKSSVLTITPNVLNQDDKNHILGTGKSDKTFTIEGDHSLIELTSGAKDDPAKITVTHIGKGIEVAAKLVMGITYDTGAMAFTPFLIETGPKGHVTVFEAGTKSTLTGDGTWTEVGEPDVGTPNTFPLNHIGPDTPTGDPELPGIVLSQEDGTGTIKYLRATYTGITFDSKGHAAGVDETYTQFEFVKVTVVTDYRVDSNKLQKKTRDIYVLYAGTESGWTDVHTGTTCP